MEREAIFVKKMGDYLLDTHRLFIMTHDFKSYKGLDKGFKSHNIIKHSKK